MELIKELYMKISQVSENQNLVCKLNKLLYGLKQVPDVGNLSDLGLICQLFQQISKLYHWMCV